MRFAVLPVLLLAACASSDPDESRYVRITSDAGRVYFARRGDIETNERSQSIVFDDLVSGKTVRLDPGTYTMRASSRSEVVRRRTNRLVYGD